VDPARGVELPALESVGTGRSLGPIAWKLGHLARQTSHLDRCVDDERGGGAFADRGGHSPCEAGDHTGTGERGHSVGDSRSHVAAEAPAATLPAVVRRRRRRHGLQLDVALRIAETHGVSERDPERQIELQAVTTTSPTY